MIEDKDYYELKNLVDVLEERMKGEKRALELQAKEYERRLEGLNHEAAKIETMKTDFVLVALHNKDVESIRTMLQTEVRELKLKIEPNTEARTKREGQTVLYRFLPIIISIALTIVSIVLLYLSYRKK